MTTGIDCTPEAVLMHGQFPHRNPILCRPHGAGEIHYLTSELRPMWSFTQPPRPDYYALHAALHASDRYVDCRAIDRPSLRAFHAVLELDPDAPGRSLMDVFDVMGRDRVGFRDLYRHTMLQRNAALHAAVVETPALSVQFKKVAYAIFKDESVTWPPKRARASVPKVIDVPALNLVIRCPLLERGDVYVPRGAIDRFVDETGFRSCTFPELYARYQEVLADATAGYELTRGGTRRSLPIGPRAFERIAGVLFASSPPPEGGLTSLYELLDLDFDGTIDAGEALVALATLCSGRVDDKLHVVFQIFDGDGNGHLDRAELRDLVHTTQLRGLHLVEAVFRNYHPASTRESTEFVLLFSLTNFAAVEENAEQALDEADSDGDGLLDEAEFTAWAKKHPLFAQLLGLSQTLFGS